MKEEEKELERDGKKKKDGVREKDIYKDCERQIERRIKVIEKDCERDEDKVCV